MAHYPYSGLSDQHRAAIRRQADARTLLERQHWCGAMYLLGYVVECRLKTSLMEKYQVDTLQQLEKVLTRRFKREIKVRDHSIERLFDLLGIHDKLIGKDLRAFRHCNRWTVAWRYRPDEGNKKECLDFFDAVRRFLNFIEHNC